MAGLGRKFWVIAEGYIPGTSTGPAPEMTSHETVCMLNPGRTDAKVEIMLYFEDRDPVGPYKVTLPAQRTKHLRFNDLDNPAPVPRDTPYASIIAADVPIICQHTRLDSRQPPHALLSTIAWAGEE